VYGKDNVWSAAEDHFLVRFEHKKLERGVPEG